MARVTLRGGPELRARLVALGSPEIERKIYVDWKKSAVPRMKQGPWRSANGIRGVYGGAHRAAIVGPFWFIFLDRGTKAHDIEPQSISGNNRNWKTSLQPNGPEKGYRNPKYLAVGKGQIGFTIFAKKVTKRAQRRHPFITQAARDAAAEAITADQIIRVWNRKSGRGRWTRVKPAA